MRRQGLYSSSRVGGHPTLLFIHDLPEARPNRDVWKHFFHAAAINERFPGPDSYQAKLLQRSGKSIVLFDDALSSFFLTFFKLNGRENSGGWGRLEKVMEMSVAFDATFEVNLPHLLRFCIPSHRRSQKRAPQLVTEQTPPSIKDLSDPRLLK